MIVTHTGIYCANCDLAARYADYNIKIGEISVDLCYSCIDRLAINILELRNEDKKSIARPNIKEGKLSEKGFCS